MSGNYIPLYRKYRPQTLETLVGQEHIKKTLTSAIELGKISHAYLFTGPRGTGKTSTARILAKSLNCKNGPTIHPCGVCESCQDITNSVPIDVIEIDAASNRKVEDAQNILEKVQYVPVNGRYKIYIIDEVHMLTNHAFNALLKTLEEPPENVIFILATTEVHKVLDTIKSRCQRFDFRRITTEDIVKHLRFISDKEQINITDDALLAIAKNSAGGMRDSISLLDQLSLLGMSKEITVDDVNSVLGRISFDVLFDLSSKIISSKPNESIELLNKIYNSGNEPLQILTNLCEYFKNLLIVKTCNSDMLQDLTGLNSLQIDELKKQKELLETQQIVFLIERISYYIKEIKLAVNQHLWLEVCLIDLSNMAENSKLLELQQRLNAIEVGNIQPISTPQIVMTKPAPVPPQNVVENIAIKRACELFGCNFANVQPNSGCQANQAAYLAFLKPGDCVLGMGVNEGGHISHSLSIGFAGTFYNVIPYGLTDDGLLDYDSVKEKIYTNNPKLLIVGASAYPREIDFKRIREIVDEYNNTIFKLSILYKRLNLPT